MAKWAGLTPGHANRVPLSPVGFLRRSAEIYPERIAVIHGADRWTYAQTYERARRLASALRRHGVERGDVVATMLPNVPAMVEAHFGVPMAGAVLCTINTRLEAETVAYILDHGVTHMCGAPTVLGLLASAPAEQQRPFANVVHIQTGGSPPPARVIEAVEGLGFRVLQIYGMTELQGPSHSCQPQADWAAMPIAQRAELMARQGVRYPVVEHVMVGDPLSCEPMPRDGQSVGEIMLRSNTVMLGYFKDPAATAEAFHGGWMHTGDLAVCHPDHYVEIKDRKKDIIISGGENISSVEVEIALYKHPAVQLAAVVARADPKWGETPCAFIQLKPGATATEAELVEWCRERIAHYKVPRKVVFGAIPTTATGKIQKFVLRETARGVE
ncbi:MAG: AMP-binding protein [Caulobacter sp.]|nr:AMP-binding protein [Vitreoscilla sp.]